MGTTESKLEGSEDDQEVVQGSVSTPSQQIKLLHHDPRSPSLDIARTPIEVLKTPAQPSAAALDTIRKVNDVIHTIDDPRSPSIEFHRTPIVVDIKKKTTLHNKILDNARITQLVPTPIKCKPLRTVRLSEVPKLVEQNVSKVSENKRNSIVGLLETNIDFIETDLDVVIQNKSINKESSVSELSVETENSVSKAEDISNQVEEEQIIEDLEISFKQLDIVNDSHQEILENNLLSIDALDRKLTNLIYEDKMQQNECFTPNNVIKHRTPLHEQNTNSQAFKSIPTLKVSDKPRNLPKSGSKIPVFKDRKIKGNINIQCENTPPRMKAKKSQWAAEDSMII